MYQVEKEQKEKDGAGREAKEEKTDEETMAEPPPTPSSGWRGSLSLGASADASQSLALQWLHKVHETGWSSSSPPPLLLFCCSAALLLSVLSSSCLHQVLLEAKPLEWAWAQIQQAFESHKAQHSTAPGVKPPVGMTPDRVALMDELSRLIGKKAVAEAVQTALKRARIALLVDNALAAKAKSKRSPPKPSGWWRPGGFKGEGEGLQGMPWTAEEDEAIIRLVAQFGPKWR